jgi:hypothetical protein
MKNGEDMEGNFGGSAQPRASLVYGMYDINAAAATLHKSIDHHK